MWVSKNMEKEKERKEGNCRLKKNVWKFGKLPANQNDNFKI